MCTVKQVVYVRQQTVQHTPVKLKHLYLTVETCPVCFMHQWVAAMGLGSEGSSTDDMIRILNCSELYVDGNNGSKSGH